MATTFEDVLAKDPRDMTDEEWAALKGFDPEADFVSHLKFDIWEDWTETDRHPEDGSTVAASRFYVRATADDGRRWRHFFAFCGPTRYEGDWDDGFGLAPRSGEFKSDKLAGEHAEKLLKRIYAAQMDGTLRSLNPEFWYRDSPVYGSESWTQADEYGLMDDEERNARFPGRYM